MARLPGSGFGFRGSGLGVRVCREVRSPKPQTPNPQCEAVSSVPPPGSCAALNTKSRTTNPKTRNPTSPHPETLHPLGPKRRVCGASGADYTSLERRLQPEEPQKGLHEVCTNWFHVSGPARSCKPSTPNPTQPRRQALCPNLYPLSHIPDPPDPSSKTLNTES
jgi:hypothetical protein